MGLPLKHMTSVERDRVMASVPYLNKVQLAVLRWQLAWADTARGNQEPPDDPEWTEWGLLAGRGFGKTRVGAEWLGMEHYFDPGAHPSAVIAPTLGDVRNTCFEGPAGLLAILPPEIVTDYNKTNLIITVKTESGREAIIRGFSAEEPERLRGPQFARAWGDELAAWTFGEDTLDMMFMGLRLGPLPRFCWTTTPKPRDVVRRLVAGKRGRYITNGKTSDNAANLPASFFENLKQYEGTVLGRQELEGELIDAEEGGIINRSDIKLWPSGQELPAFDFILVSLDTAFTERTLNKKTFDADPTACQVWGSFSIEGKRCLMLLDCWDDMLGLPALIKAAKREMRVAYGDDHERPMLKPLIGRPKLATSGRKPDLLLIEDKGSGISLRQMLAKEEIYTHAYNPGRADKLARLHAVSHVFHHKRIYVPESEHQKGKPKSWCTKAITQWCSFQGTGSVKHDDHVDAMTQAIRLFIDKRLIDFTIMTAEKRKKREEGEMRPRAPRVNPYAA